MQLDNPLSGVITPMVTPLKSQNQLDITGLEALIELLLNGGVHGIFILGTTGEGPSLSYRLQYELVERVSKLVNKKIPVLVGITGTSKEESINLAKHSYTFGADAVVAAPPYYFTPSQIDLREYFKSLADQVPLPLFLYNMPSHTKVNFKPDTVRYLAEHKNIVGLKDSSGDLIYFQKIISLMMDRPDFSILMGPEELLMHSILSGGHGGVCGGSNMFPELYVEMYESTLSKDFSKIEPLQTQILQICSTIYSIKTYGSGYLQGLKCALSVLGICDNVLADPYRSFGKKETEIIRGTLEKLKVVKRVKF